MSQTILILLAVVAYSFFQVFVSRAANRIDSNLSASIYNFVGLLLPLFFYIGYKVKKVDLIPTSRGGMVFSVLTGLAIACFSILLVKIFEKGTLSYVMPLIYGGTIFLSTLVGIFFFKEKISINLLFGLAFILTGITFIIFSKT